MVAQVIKESSLTWDTTLAEALPEIVDIMDETVRRGLARPRANRLGTFTYDNNNFNIAGAITERTFNSTWENMLEEQIFRPLGMENCGLGPNDEESDISIDNPWPYTLVKFPKHQPLPLDYLSRKYRDNPPALNSAGRVHCPVASYAKFLQAHADGARSLMTPLGLSAEDFQVLHTSYQEEEDAPYTPGAWRHFNVSGSEEKYMLTHTGSNTYNLALAKLIIGLENGELYVATTNVAGTAAEEGVRATVREMMEGRLLS